jgi:hypothetical protein
MIPRSKPEISCAFLSKKRPILNYVDAYHVPGTALDSGSLAVNKMGSNYSQLRWGEAVLEEMSRINGTESGQSRLWRYGMHRLRERLGDDCKPPDKI